MDVPERLRALLVAQGRRWPASIEHFETIGSTNDHLKARARAGAPEWSVVLADRQTAGRGREGRPWVSPAGNLHLSTLLRPALPAEAAALLPLVAGLAVGEALRGLGLPAELKWPNDVLVRGRKVSGILTEALSGPAGLEIVVVGIGINVEVDPRDLPAEIREGATSVRAEGVEADPLALAAAVLARLTVWYDALARNVAQALDAWRALSVPWWGRAVEVRSGDRAVRGVARGLDPRGALLLEVGGALIPVLSGEVRELRLAPPE